MTDNPVHQYGEVMARIADRIRLVRQIQTIGKSSFSANEGIAFQLRKIVEGIAYACVVASETGTKSKIRSARGHWNASKVLNELDRRSCLTLPNPSEIRVPTDEEAKLEVNHVIQGRPELCLTKLDVIEIYERTHAWLHEVSPFRAVAKTMAVDRADILWEDFQRISNMLERHFIAVSGEGFFCTLFDKQDGMMKVLPLSRLSA